MRNKNVESLRGIAILLLLFYHFTISLGIFKDMTLILMDEAFCQFAMVIFFVISGYGTFLHYKHREEKNEKIGIFDYVKRRFTKIAPSYYFCLVFILLFTTGGVYLSKDGLKSVLIYGCLIQNLFPARSGDINGVTWTIALLMQFYLISYPLYKVVKKWGWKSYIAFLIVSLCINKILCGYVTFKGYPEVYYVIASIREIFTTIDIFIIGMLCGKYSQKTKNLHMGDRKAIFFAGIIFIAGIGIFIKMAYFFGGFFGDGLKFYLWKPVVSIIIGSIILLIEPCQWPAYKSWLGKFIQFVAKVEYNTYLWHMILFGNLKATSLLFNELSQSNPILTVCLLMILALIVGYFATLLTNNLAHISGKNKQYP